MLRSLMARNKVCRLSHSHCWLWVRKESLTHTQVLVFLAPKKVVLICFIFRRTNTQVFETQLIQDVIRGLSIKLSWVWHQIPTSAAIASLVVSWDGTCLGIKQLKEQVPRQQRLGSMRYFGRAMAFAATWSISVLSLRHIYM